MKPKVIPGAMGRSGPPCGCRITAMRHLISVHTSTQVGNLQICHCVVELIGLEPTTRLLWKGACPTSSPGRTPDTDRSLTTVTSRAAASTEAESPTLTETPRTGNSHVIPDGTRWHSAV